MNHVDLIALLAIAQLVHFGRLVGQARSRYAVEAPAVSGHPGFERMHRVQMNTLELMVAFLPALFLAAKYWPQPYVACVGALYLIGRLLYWRSYVTAPAGRTMGFAVSLIPILVLLAGALVGVVRAGFH